METGRRRRVKEMVEEINLQPKNNKYICMCFGKPIQTDKETYDIYYNPNSRYNK